LDSTYDVTTITVRTGKQAEALAGLKDGLSAVSELRACWFSEIGPLNQFLIVSKAENGGGSIAARRREIEAANPFGIGELIVGMSMDSFVSFDFIAPLEPGELGPIFEVRTYGVKAGGLSPIVELWRKAVPARAKLSPLLAALYSVSGPVARFIHLWPSKSLDERARVRAKAVADGLWPPPGGAAYFASQENAIYLAAPFSPIR
jgi:hypothetical protein